PASAAAADAREVRVQNDAGLGGLEIVDDGRRFNRADHDRIEIEFLRQGESAQDLALLFDLEGDGHLAIERGRERVERRLERTGWRVLVAVGEGARLLLPLRVVE